MGILLKTDIDSLSPPPETPGRSSPPGVFLANAEHTQNYAEQHA